jgi:hypothetical protein
VPLSGEAMFRFPHLDTPLNDSGAAQGITNDSFDSTTFWIGSKNFNISSYCGRESHWRRNYRSSLCDSGSENIRTLTRTRTILAANRNLTMPKPLLQMVRLQQDQHILTRGIRRLCRAKEGMGTRPCGRI